MARSFEPVRPTGLPPLPKNRQIAILVDDGNFSQLDMYAQIILRELPNDPHANLAAAAVAKHFKFETYFRKYFLQAQKGSRDLRDLAEDLHINVDALLLYQQEILEKNEKYKAFENLKTHEQRYHLIKAWGFGFGSEMASLLGQAYLAEILDRTPIVHWGKNFLYREPGNESVFNHFFKPFNDCSISTTLEKGVQSIFPKKWHKENLLQENIQKKTGEFSKLSSLYFLISEAQLTVADYYAGIINIKPWLPENSQFKAMSFDDTYRYLMKKYLSPTNEIQKLVKEFIELRIASPYIAVHARGSDKDEGYRSMTSIPRKTLEYAKSRLLKMPSDVKLFLMTDDEKLLSIYEKEFGDRLITTDSQRSTSQVGVHYKADTNKRVAGQEMLIDMLIAAQSNCFIGLGLSNPSQLICYMGDFSPDNYVLFGENRLKQFNTHLYKTVAVR